MQETSYWQYLLSAVKPSMKHSYSNFGINLGNSQKIKKMGKKIGQQSYSTYCSDRPELLRILLQLY